MPSRKRNKGKARKAKATSATLQNNDGGQQQLRQQPPQREQETQCQQLQQIIRNLSLQDNNECTHGFSPPPVGDSCHTFMSKFESALIRATDAGAGGKMTAVLFSLQVQFNDQLEELEKSSEREHVYAGIVTLGTDYLLVGDDRFTAMASIAAMFLVTGNFEPVSMSTISTIHHLCVENERGTTRFFCKRNKCSCLKKKYRQLQTKPKLSICCCCEVEKEKKDLMVCTGCNVIYYCSKQCQRTAWPEHKVECEWIKSKVEHGLL